MQTPSEALRIDALVHAEAAGWPWVRTWVWEFWDEANWRATVTEATTDELADLLRALRS